MSKPEMKPGDVRTFKRGEGNAVVLAVGVWATRETEKGPIRIDITGPKDMHTTVTNNPGSERYHRTLFRDLRRVLLENKCWPFGDEGSETEVRSESGMTTHDIIWKFTQQLNGGITSEPQVVYLLAGIRKLMEHDQIEDKFVNLKFHCDWTLHSRLSGEAEHQILRLFDAAYPILTRYEKQTSRRVDRISEMRLFEEELSVVLLNYGLPPLTIKHKDGWIHFLYLYAKVVEDIPLEVRASRADAAKNLTRVIVKVHRAAEKGGIPFRLTWEIHDKNGDIFAI